MSRLISLYFYSLLIFVHYIENVYSNTDAVIAVSRTEIPDDIKKLLLDCQFDRTRLQLEALKRKNQDNCQVKNEISKDVSTSIEKRKVILDDDETTISIISRIEKESTTERKIKDDDEIEITTERKIKSLPQKCTDVTEKVSGVYILSDYVAEALPLKVYCDFDTQGGGWTLIQRRINGTVSFNRSWLDYKNGFGDVNGEHWLGLEHIHRMTTNEPHELLIILEDYDNQTRWAKYDWFILDDENEKYSINSLGSYSGDAGDSLNNHLIDKFSTYDMDNDSWRDGNCASSYKSGWWFNRCLTTNLNGPALKGEFDKSQCCRGIHWLDFRGNQYSLKSSKIMLRPKSYVVSNEK